MSAGPALADARDAASWKERLAVAGVGVRARPQLAALFVRCAEALRDGGVPPGTPLHSCFVPGRIEVLGKHTDYAGGRSLLCAVERGFCTLAAARRDARVMLHDVAAARRAVITIDAHAPAPAAEWALYPHVVAVRLARDFPGTGTGADIAFASNLPAAAGLSSSSAFVTAMFLALAALNRVEESAAYRRNIASREQLADYLGAVENGLPYGALPGGVGVGTRGGSEDHVAILCGRPAALLQYAFRPVRFERALPLPADSIFVVAASGVTAEKSGAARALYNRLSDRAAVLERLWLDHTSAGATSLGAALDSDPDAYATLRALLDRTPAGTDAHERDALRRRLDQFAAETLEIIPAAGTALASGDSAAFGAEVARSQRLAERLLGNQVAETRYLTRAARELGACAASAFGAGFGGSVWALVDAAEAERFRRTWRADYLRRFPRHDGRADFAIAPAGVGAVHLT